MSEFDSTWRKAWASTWAVSRTAQLVGDENKEIPYSNTHLHLHSCPNQKPPLHIPHLALQTPPPPPFPLSHPPSNPPNNRLIPRHILRILLPLHTIVQTTRIKTPSIKPTV